MRFIRILRAGLSLLLGLAVASIWIRSHFKGDHFGKMTANDSPTQLHWTITDFDIGNGGVGWHQIIWSAPPSITTSYPGLLRDRPLIHLHPRPTYPDFTNAASSPPRRNKTFLGFKIVRNFGGFPGASFTSSTVIIPFWSLFLLFLLLFLILCFHRQIFRRRRKAGLCPHCGYDLRASPDRCPECGDTRNRPVAAA